MGIVQTARWRVPTHHSTGRQPMSGRPRLTRRHKPAQRPRAEHRMRWAVADPHTSRALRAGCVRNCSLLAGGLTRPSDHRPPPHSAARRSARPPTEGPICAARAPALRSAAARHSELHTSVYISKRRRRERPRSSPGSQVLARTVPATIGRHWRSARFSISRMSVRKCKGAQGASQGAAGVSGPLGMIPRWPRRPVSLCARAGKELGSGKGGRGLRSQSRRWADHRLVVARGAAQLAVPLFTRSKGAFSPY